MYTYILHKVDISQPWNKFPDKGEAIDMSVVGVYLDPQTAEDEMMWRIQNDFYDKWKEALEMSPSHLIAEAHFSQWINKHFVSDSEWMLSEGTRLYILKIEEFEV